MQRDNVLRTEKATFEVGLKQIGADSVPNTVLNLRRKRNFPKGEQVKRFYSEDLKTGRIREYL